MGPTSDANSQVGLDNGREYSVLGEWSGTSKDPATSALPPWTPVHPNSRGMGCTDEMEPACRLHPMYKLQHAHTRPHGKLNEPCPMRYVIHVANLNANKKTPALKRCQDKTHRCVRSTTSHVQHEKQPLQAFALAVQPCADTSSRNTSWLGSAHKAVLQPAVLPHL